MMRYPAMGIFNSNETSELYNDVNQLQRQAFGFKRQSGQTHRPAWWWNDNSGLQFMFTNFSIVVMAS